MNPDFESDIKAAVRVLEAGGVVLYPTDTIWGLGCDATNEAAVEKVFALKHRPKEKSCIILLADARDILQHVAAPPPDVFDLLESFTTPTTIIYDGAIGFAENAIAADGSAAIRVTQDAFCKALIKRFRKPVISTSANISGAASPAFFKEISTEIVRGANYVVQYRQNDETPRQASRLARLTEDGGLIYLR